MGKISMAASQNQVALNFSALCKLMRPVVNFCLRRGLKYQDLCEAAKLTFVADARAELEGNAGAVSTSRLSVLTGLQRKDISRLLERGSEPAPISNLLIRVVGQWQNDQRFLDRSGKPRALSCEGPDSEFAGLVAALSTDLSSYTVLFELERLGLVRKEGKLVSLVSDVYVPSREKVEEGLTLLAEDCRDLMQGVEENIFDPGTTPNLHIKTQYDNVCVEAIDEIRTWFLDKGSEFHEQARNFLSKHDKDLNPRLHNKQGGARVCVGIFSLAGLKYAKYASKKSEEAR